MVPSWGLYDAETIDFDLKSCLLANMWLTTLSSVYLQNFRTTFKALINISKFSGPHPRNKEKSEQSFKSE